MAITRVITAGRGAATIVGGNGNDDLLHGGWGADQLIEAGIGSHDTLLGGYGRNQTLTSQGPDALLQAGVATTNCCKQAAMRPLWLAVAVRMTRSSVVEITMSSRRGVDPTSC